MLVKCIYGFKEDLYGFGEIEVGTLWETKDNLEYNMVDQVELKLFVGESYWDYITVSAEVFNNCFEGCGGL